MCSLFLIQTFLLLFFCESALFISLQYVEDNLGVMSVGFLLASPDDAVIWRGPKKNGECYIVEDVYIVLLLRSMFVCLVLVWHDQ